MKLMAEFIGICFFTGQRKVCGDVKALHYIITLGVLIYYINIRLKIMEH